MGAELSQIIHNKNLLVVHIHHAQGIYLYMFVHIFIKWMAEGEKYLQSKKGIEEKYLFTMSNVMNVFGVHAFEIEIERKQFNNVALC